MSHSDHDHHEESPIFLPYRPRRNRASAAIRSLVRETELCPQHFILPMFVVEGRSVEEPIGAMPGVARLSIDRLVETARKAADLGIPAVALFPALPDALKDPFARESANPNGLLQHAVAAIKSVLPQLAVITDVAMDPYSSDGHDGLVQEGRIVNDETLPILAEMALAQAEAGADIVAPSDMMDGRVAFIREALDAHGFTEVAILAYSAKYASAFYGPFREALDSKPRAGDKKTYQMDPANVREARREALLDQEEGADIIMVKPALPYLDVITTVQAAVDLPVAAYQVSGEYAMIQAVAEKGWMAKDALILETLISIRRAGADMILTYFAMEAAALLR